MRVRFNKINGFIKAYNRNRCLVLLDSGWFDKIYVWIKYLSEKSGIADNINHYANKDKKDYYYNIFSEKGLYKDKFNIEYL